MDKRDWTILALIVNEGYESHRALGTKTGFSLGLINSSLREIIKHGYLDENYNPTEKAFAHINSHSPKKAIILAAGPGFRMFPITNTPKALLTVNGEKIIERIIKQLRAVGVFDISIVVGYMMEKFEYLIDEFDVKLVYNKNFTKNDTLHSLLCTKQNFSNTYIVPADMWFSRNPFRRTEYHSWYSVSALIDDDSFVRVNRKMEIIPIKDEVGGNTMMGISYICPELGDQFTQLLTQAKNQRLYSKASWEEVIFQKNSPINMYAKIILGAGAYDINTYEQLRDLDFESKNLPSNRINLICKAMNVNTDEIYDISPLSKGMTNLLMRFSVNNKKYLMRIPGQGSDKLTNRHEEVAVYEQIKNSGICDNIVYINGDSGYKITEFWEDARVCDPKNMEEVRSCMQLLRKFHEGKFSVNHEFNVFDKFNYYESLNSTVRERFSDYDITRRHIFELKEILEMFPQSRCLCHIDAISDNFLITKNNHVHLIDWEYAGMADPYMDIAMFCLYSDYNEKQVDEIIQMYLGEDTKPLVFIKVYCYMSICGLLWTNWCEYKLEMGVNYGEYELKQYQYSKKYYKKAMNMAKNISNQKIIDEV